MARCAPGLHPNVLDFCNSRILHAKHKRFEPRSNHQRDRECVLYSWRTKCTAVQQVVKRRCLFVGGVGVVAVQQVVKRHCLFAGGVGVVAVQQVVKRRCLFVGAIFSSVVAFRGGASSAILRFTEVGS